jgi:hypothetical protein
MAAPVSLTPTRWNLAPFEAAVHAGYSSNLAEEGRTA